MTLYSFVTQNDFVNFFNVISLQTMLIKYMGVSRHDFTTHSIVDRYVRSFCCPRENVLDFTAHVSQSSLSAYQYSLFSPLLVLSSIIALSYTAASSLSAFKTFCNTKDGEAPNPAAEEPCSYPQA